MPKGKADNRARLLHAAEKVTYRQGFARATLADIASEARIPLGNVYYYFKTKDDISGAIIERRFSRFKKLLKELDQAPSPKERLCAFVQIKINNRESLARRGCPVGTLCSELHKNRDAVARKSTILFAEALAWMESQFQALGKGPESRALAVHLLSATQGVSVLAHAFHDPALIETEAAHLKAWVLSL
jgi:TetR/AcrR family transcriptional regulator, transcriptional repressor for nem operon